MTTPVPPVGPHGDGPRAVPPIRILTPAEREQEARRAHAEGGSGERRRRRAHAEGGSGGRRPSDPEPPAQGVDVRA